MPHAKKQLPNKNTQTWDEKCPDWPLRPAGSGGRRRCVQWVMGTEANSSPKNNSQTAALIIHPITAYFHDVWAIWRESWVASCSLLPRGCTCDWGVDLKCFFFFKSLSSWLWTQCRRSPVSCFVSLSSGIVGQRSRGSELNPQDSFKK